MSIAHEQDPKRRPGYRVAIALGLMTLAAGILSIINSQEPAQYTSSDAQGFIEYIPAGVEPSVEILHQPLHAPTLPPDAGFPIVDGINPATEGINIQPGDGFIDEGFSIANPSEFDHILKSTTNLTELPISREIVQSDPRIAALYEASNTFLKMTPPVEDLFSYRLYIQEQRNFPQETRIIPGIELSPGETIDYAYQKLAEGYPNHLEIIIDDYVTYLDDRLERNLITEEEHEDAFVRVRYWQEALFLHQRALNDLWTITQVKEAFGHQGPVDWSKSPQAFRLYTNWYTPYSDIVFSDIRRLRNPEPLQHLLLEYDNTASLINALTSLFATDLRDLFR